MADESTEDVNQSDSSLTVIEQHLGYSFKDRNWLIRALTHRSIHTRGVKNDYERLEFLGDAVLDLAVAHLLLDKYPEVREGDLSKMRAALVNTASLAQIARDLELGASIRLSKGEQTSGGAQRPSILADVVEALFGAIYRESGYEAARISIQKLFESKIETVVPTDPKTELQELLHALGDEPPEYILEGVEGPEHAPTFVSAVIIKAEIHGKGKGSTKKASQQAAAAEALSKLREANES